jgi:hypothetical protein
MPRDEFSTSEFPFAAFETLRSAEEFVAWLSAIEGALRGDASR